jgi:hypothetical protein
MNTGSLRLSCCRISCAFFCNSLLLTAPSGRAQTTQPYLFAATANGNTSSSGFVTVLRNGATGVLTMVPNASVSFKDPCSSTTIDPTGSFRFA